MKPLHDFDLIFFGATGDLALRKLLPAMYYAFRDNQRPAGWRVLGVARREFSRDEYLTLVGDSCRQFIPAADFDDATWTEFCTRIDYLPLDATDPAGFAALRGWFDHSAERVRVFYLSTGARLFGPICEGLARHDLVTPLSRVVLEKPLGHDCASAEAINEIVGNIFPEEQIFRIDHYLGKEPVQNLLALRFGNSIFEPLWNRGSVRDVQITIAEQVGVEDRGEYYDPSGALRDMVQSHLLQLLCILGMEPPTSLDADALRDEKLKVLRALRPITAANIKEKTVRGQYRSGAVNGKPVPGYLDEPGVPPDSSTETYVAIRADIDNWRWSGVPFFLRTGKRLPERMAEIVITFRPVPHRVLPVSAASGEPNRLIIRLQPDEGVKLFLLVKVPGEGMNVKPVALDLDFAETFKNRQWEAYERLLMEVIQGNLTLFMRRDELATAWRWIDPILDGWRALDEPPKAYTAGTWGPAAASALILREGLAWREEI